MIIMCECLPIWGVAIVLYHVHTVEGRLLFLNIPLKIGAVWHTIAFKVSAFHYFWPKNYCRADLLYSLKLKPNNHYRCRTLVFVTRTSV